jgi:DMSO/TMAO reductase YedYZ molybdopterin-dependent catalytic subunit
LVERPGPLPLEELRRLPHESVEAAYETRAGPERHAFTGVHLSGVLRHVGVVAEPGDRTPLLRRYLVVSARDGYRVVLSGGVLDPDFGNAPLLAWERDGRPLAGDEGPLELVAPGDRLVSRYVWGVVRIEVLGIASAPEVGG